MSDLTPEEKSHLSPEEKEFWSGVSPGMKEALLSVPSSNSPEKAAARRMKEVKGYIDRLRKVKEEEAAEEAAEKAAAAVAAAAEAVKVAAAEKLAAMPKSAAYTEAVEEAVRIIHAADEEYEKKMDQEKLATLAFEERIAAIKKEQKPINKRIELINSGYIYTTDIDEEAQIKKHAIDHNEITNPSEFFKFLFFDTYIRDGRGANRFVIANIFKNYISRYIVNKKFVNFTILETFNTLFDNREIWEEIAFNYDKFNDYLTVHGNYIFLSGWSAKGGGHAITIYIEKEKENTHTIYIINSGAGLENHGEHNSEGEYPIIIKFNNINNDQVKAIYSINYFFTNYSSIEDRDRSLNTYNDLLKEKKSNPIFKCDKQEIEDVFNTYIKDIYDMNDKIGAKLLYKCIFNILKEKSIYKYDKEQMSGTCTYFSTYYFIKSILFNEGTNEQFDLFIQKIKNLQANAFLLNYRYEASPDKELTGNSFSLKQNIRLSTIASTLLKDRVISPSIKEHIAIILKKSYTNEGFVDFTKKPDKRFIGIFDNFIRSVEEFMNGKKTINKIKEILFHINTIGFIFSIDRENTSITRDLFFIISIRCLLECYNAIGKENGEEIIPFTTKENYETTFYRSDHYKHVMEIIEKINEYISNKGAFDQEAFCKNILIQCLFKIMPMPSTEEFPFIEYIKDKDKIYNDEYIKRIFYNEYTNTSMPFLYNFSFRKVYSELLRRRGLLLLNSRNKEDPYNIMVFYKNVNIWIFMRIEERSPYRYTNFDTYLEKNKNYIQDYTKLDDKTISSHDAGNRFNIEAYIYNLDNIALPKFYFTNDTNNANNIKKIITSGKQFPFNQYEEDSKYSSTIKGITLTKLYGNPKPSKLNNSKIMTIAYTLNNIISSINFGSVDDMELKDLDIFINESPSSELTDNIGYDLYEFENISNTQKEGPPVISLENYIRNHFIIDKRNDMLTYIMNRLDLEQFKKLAGKLPIEVYENLLYLLYIYKYDFVIENRDILKAPLSKTSSMRYALEGHLSFIYISMLKKKKHGANDIYPKEMNDYFIQNIFNSSPLKVVINNIKELACKQPKQGYYLNNDIETLKPNKMDKKDEDEDVAHAQLKTFKYHFKIYSPLEDNNKFVYFKDETPYEITIEGVSIILTDRGEKYKYTKIDTIENRKVKILHSKINYCIDYYSEPVIWKHIEDDIYRIECEEIDGGYFEVMGDTVNYIDTINNKTYTVKLEHKTNEGIWIYLTHNTFLIENDEGTKILLFMTDTSLSNFLSSYNSLYEDRFWDNLDSNTNYTLNAKLEEAAKIQIVNKIYIINLHYSCLSIDTTSYDDYMALFISYQLFGNGLALALLFSKMSNLIGMDQKSKDKSQYRYYNYQYFKDKMNIPIWGLYLDENDDDNSTRRIEINRFELLSKSDMNINLEELLKNPNYKLIAKMSHKFECIQKVVEFPDYINSYEDAPLRKFIKEFRYLCDKQADKCVQKGGGPFNNIHTSINRINKAIQKSRKIINSPLRHNNVNAAEPRDAQEASRVAEENPSARNRNNEARAIAAAEEARVAQVAAEAAAKEAARVAQVAAKEAAKVAPVAEAARVANVEEDDDQEIFFSLILNEHFPSIPLLYAKHWKIFYTKLIHMKYRRITSTLDVVKDADNDDLCGFIIKMIEPLDPLLIYGWDKPRQIEDLLFELQTGNFIRAKQKSILEAIYNQDHIKSVVANEILMGQGKTSTLTPLIILNRYYQKAIRYFTVVLPSHLVQPSYEILFDLINIMPTITVNRNINNFTSMRDKVLHIISDVTIKTIVLKGIKSVENLVDVPKGVCQDITEEPTFSKIISKENDFYIFDEVDSLLNPLKSDLNIPKPPQIDHKKRKDIFRICFHSLKNLFTGSTPTINDSDTVKIKHPRLRDTYIYSEAYSGDDRDLIAPIFNTKISDTLLHTLSMVYNQNYGFGSLNKDKKWTCSKNHFVAIPYSANLTPVEDSEFTDYELFIILSIYCYFSNEIRPIDVSIVVDIMAKKIMGFGSLPNDPELLQNIYLSLYPTLSKTIGPTFIDIFNKKKASTNYDAECEKIAKEMSSEAERKYDFIEYYLGTIIFERFAKIYVEQSNISMVDIFDPSISSQKVTFSGTVNMNLPGRIITDLLETSFSFESGQISEIQKDDTVGPAIELAFYGITTRVPQLYYNENDDKEAKLIQHIIENINTNTYQALIDTAGILLKTTPEQLIQKINEALVDRTKVLMYVTKEDVRKVMVDGVVRNYKNETFDNLFIYYDHKHCVGTDFKQPFKMHGLVTIDTKNNLTEIAQGIFRLRFINIGHSVDFYIIARKPAVNNIRKQNQQLFNYLVEKDKQFITNSTKPSSLQCSKYVYRRQQKAEVNSYTEQIFFDTLLTDDYKNYAEYINFNFQRYQASGLRFKSGIVMTLSDKNPSHTAVNLQIAEEIAEEVAISTEIAVAKISLMGMPLKFEENDIEMTLDDYLAFHSNNKFTKNNSITDETGTVWNLFVSRPVEYKIIANLKNVDNDDDNQWFYFTVNDSPNSILLLCYYEVVVLLNHLGDNPNIAITDWYGQSFTKTKKEFPRVIRLLLAHKSYDIYNQLASLKVYCSKNGDADTSSIQLSDETEGTEVESKGRPLTKIECLDYYFGFKYPFRDFKCNNEPDWEKPDAWTSYLQFPAAVSETLKTAVIETLIKKYIGWVSTQATQGGRRIQGRRLKKTRKGSTSRRRRVTRKQ